jgi:hypothetical protein
LALSTLLAATAFTDGTNDVLGVGELGRLALVELFEADLVLLLYRTTLPRDIATTGHAAASHTRHATKSAHAAEHLRKDVVHVGAAAAHAVGGVERGHAVRVVKVSLIVIVKDFVGLLCSLEPDLSFSTLFFCDLVGVVR